MDDKIVEIIKTDIKRCAEHKVNEGSYLLYQALIGKYNGLFPKFSEDIPKSGKITTSGEFNFRPELNAIKEKLELILVVEQNKDPLYKFKEMMSTDIDSLCLAINNQMDENEKQNLYLSVCAKYHPYVPQLGTGLYQYYDGFYEEVIGESLEYNIRQIYNKLMTFRSLNYPGLGETVANVPQTVVTVNTHNENNNTVQVTFEDVRKQVENMTSLPEDQIEEIMEKINEIEAIVKSTESKAKKWSKAKEIIKWIADKGVDVGISLLPLLLQIG